MHKPSASESFGHSLSGRLAGGVHVYPLRVYYEDTDAAGIVYYANYLKFAERARTEMMRILGDEHSRLMDGHGIAFAVRHCDADFRAPAGLDDVLEVHTRVIEMGGASMLVGQDVKRDGQDLVRLRLRLVCISKSSFRPTRLPGSLRDALGGGNGDSERVLSDGTAGR